jgi:hypothetical protein
VAVITLMLEQSQAREEIYCHDVEATTFLILSLPESSVLAAKGSGLLSARWLSKRRWWLNAFCVASTRWCLESAVLFSSLFWLITHPHEKDYVQFRRPYRCNLL